MTCFKTIPLTITLLGMSFSSATSALACSKSASYYMDTDDYRRYRSTKSKRLFHKKSSAYVIQTLPLGPVLPPPDPTENPQKPFGRYNPKPHPYPQQKVGVLVLETLHSKAHPTDFENLPFWTKDQVYPIRPEADAVTETLYAQSKRSFPFWDKLMLSFPIADKHVGGSSCGHFPLRVLDANRFYLVVNLGGRGLYAEPIAHANAPLVQDFRAILLDKPLHKLKRTPQGFFSNMDGYATIRVDACPINQNIWLEPKTTEQSLNYVWDSQTGEATKDWDSPSNFSVIDSYNFPVERLSMKNFMASQARYGSAQELLCHENEEYLVISAEAKHLRHETFFRWQSPKPNGLRYIKLTHGKIKRDDVISQIEITGEDQINLTDIQNWIKQGHN